MPETRIIIEDSFARGLGEVTLGDDTVIIGRDKECGIVLASPYVSRRHARIERDGRGHVIRPYGLNGTYVNKSLVRDDEARPIAPGDVVSLPGFHLKIVDLGAGGARRHRQTLELMRRFSELKAGLHDRLLAKVDLRALTTQYSEEKHRKERIRQVLDEILAGELELDEELTEFIVREAFRRALTDRILLEQAPGIGDGSGAFGAWTSDPLERSFQEIVERCARTLGLHDTAAPLRHRIEAIAERFEQVIEQHAPAMTAELRRFVTTGAIRHDLEALVFGLGPLEDLLRMPDLTEVMVIGRDRIFVEKSGKLEETGRAFPRDEDLEVVIGRIVAPIGRTVNRSRPLCDARLPDGSRVNIVIPPVAIRGPAITIRKFREDPFSIDDLLAYGTLNQRAWRFLRGCILAHKNMIISGGTGSGKTTLLNTLSSQIPPHERIVVIEDAAELQLRQPNLVVLEAKKANVEGEGEITIRDLVRNALRMRPDRIVVGECRGKEALDMLQAMNTGHDGSVTTAHANSPREMMSRLEVLVMEAGESLPVAAIHRQIAGALDLVIQISRMRDGARKITHVTEVVGFDSEEDEIILEDVFRLVEPEDPEHQPELRFTGYLPSFIDRMLGRGDVRLEDLF